MASFGTIRLQGDNDADLLTLTFTSRKVHEAALVKLRAANWKIVDEFWGYEVVTNADDALATAKFWR